MRILTLLLLSALMLPGMTAIAQNKTAPSAVRSAFAKQFPDVVQVLWEKDGTEWEGDFKLNGVMYSATYSSDGTWKETEHRIRPSAMPEVVQLTLSSEFSEYKLGVAKLKETPEGTFFEIELKGEEGKVTATINADGEVLEQEEEDEFDDED